MRKLPVTAAIAFVALTTACGGSGSTSGSPATQTLEATVSTASTPPAGAAGAGTVLNAGVGEPGNPDAFVISLKDSAGKAVATLPAGKYQIKVSDPSKIHNFHLTGPGVTETTTVPGVSEVTWDVTLQAGSYTFRCDPHPKMTGSFTVS